MTFNKQKTPLSLIILDGFGYRAEREGNAIALAKKVDTGPILERYLPPTNAARYLQYLYLAANPAAYLKKDVLVDAGDKSEAGKDYNEAHKKPEAAAPAAPPAAAPAA